MMAMVWILMLALSIVSAFFEHSIGNLTSSALKGTENAINICISLAGPLCLWSGLGRVMEKSGLTEKLGKFFHSFFRKLYPKACKDTVILGYITSNFCANLLGLGNAATPMGIYAVKGMHRLQTHPVPNDEICRFVIMNTASIQLLPTTVAAVRSAAGAASPFDILPGVWITSICSVCAGLMAAKLLRRFYA